jgi:hypothetical protein
MFHFLDKVSGGSCADAVSGGSLTYEKQTVEEA